MTRAMTSAARLSVITAYLALAFVAAIVCGAFNGTGF